MQIGQARSGLPDSFIRRARFRRIGRDQNCSIFIAPSPAVGVSSLSATTHGGAVGGGVDEGLPGREAPGIAVVQVMDDLH